MRGPRSLVNERWVFLLKLQYYVNKCCSLEKYVTIPANYFSPVLDTNFAGRISVENYMMMVALVVDYAPIVVVVVNCELILSVVLLKIF